MALPGVANKNELFIQWQDSRTLVVQGGLKTASPKKEFRGLLRKVNASENLSEKNRGEMLKAENGAYVDEHTETTGTKQGAQTGSLLILNERRVGLFERAFKLPLDVDVGGCETTLEHGLLKIDVPKKVPQVVQERLTLDDT